MTIPTNMRAAVYRGRNDIRVETIPVPRIGPNELLVRVAACGVCPTDIKKIQQGLLEPPRIFGHETAGTIVRCGALVRHWRVGQRVGLHHHVPCLTCNTCRHRSFAQCAQYKKTGITGGFVPAGGGYAEYVKVMPFVFPGIVKIPARNTFVEGALLEPVNTVLKGVNRLGLLPGDRVVVIGQGPVGLMFTRLFAVRGVKVLAVDFLAARLERAHEFGADRVVRVGKTPLTSQVERWLRGSSLEAAVVAAPDNTAVLEALNMVRSGGKVLLFAHTTRAARAEIDLGTVCADEKDLIGSYSSDFTLQKQVADWVFGRRIDVRGLVTHTFPLEKVREAIALASHPDGKTLKVIVSQE